MQTGRMSGHSTKKGVDYYVSNYHAYYFSHTLRPIVYALQNLDRNFSNLVAPPTHVSAKCLVRCKVHLVL